MVLGNLSTGRLVQREAELDRLLDVRESETRWRLAREAPDAPDRLIELAARDECLLSDREYIAWYREWRAIEAELTEVHRDPAGPGEDELPF
jgi:hypothetical protein